MFGRILAAALLTAGLATTVWATTTASSHPVRSQHEHRIPSELRAEAARYMAYNRSIKLTPQQATVKRKALEEIPAPCCSKYSMETCCCECNLARTVWGLSNHLIAERSLSADEVRAEVKAWISRINPEGFTGNACFSGGCNRSFDDNGCGGMNERELR